MEQIYTIPVNEAFEASAADHALGCPFCAIYNKLEENELDLILGASMMEPDIRIRTNEQGFCRTHYDMMFVRKNRLGMALTLESHLDELRREIKGNAAKSAKRIDKLENSCYVCDRIAFHCEHMVGTAVLLWSSDEDFPAKLKAQPYFCLPHYKKLLQYGQGRLPKKKINAFIDDCESVELTYFDELREDVSWFCKKFDYRYDNEPWYNSKDAVERAFKFLRSDLHKGDKPKKQ